MKHLYCLWLGIALSATASAQDSLFALPPNYLNSVERKAAQVSRRMEASTAKAITTLLKQEEKLFRKVQRINPAQAEHKFRQSLDSLHVLQKASRLSKLQLPAGAKQYIPSLDTLQNSLKFLEENKALLQSGKDKLQGAMSSVQSLQTSINNAAQIEQYIKAQKEALKAQLGQYTGLADDLKALNKEAYYYTQQFNEYKALLSDKKKAEKKAMELLAKSKPYQQFLQRNSQLAGLFSLPSSNADQQIEGLQTRSVVEETIRRQMGNSPQAKQAISQLMDKAKQAFDQYKDKLPDLSSSADMPDFKPNPMKRKTFLHRLELGGNLQFRKTSQYFPSNTEVAAQAAYKLNDKSNAGMGVAYTFGMGTGWEHIRFSHQAIGLRSFIDWKLKGSFFINGGAEGNYISTIRDANELKQWNRWKPSILIGLSKKYKISPKLKGNMQLLYDFMARQRQPYQNPIIIRFGYTK